MRCGSVLLVVWLWGGERLLGVTVWVWWVGGVIMLWGWEEGRVEASRDGCGLPPGGPDLVL